MDRGKDFLSTAVAAAFATMGVTVKDLSAYPFLTTTSPARHHRRPAGMSSCHTLR
jgi:hypothetical protein